MNDVNGWLGDQLEYGSAYDDARNKVAYTRCLLRGSPRRRYTSVVHRTSRQFHAEVLAAFPSESTTHSRGI